MNVSPANNCTSTLSYEENLRACKIYCFSSDNNDAIQEGSSDFNNHNPKGLFKNQEINSNWLNLSRTVHGVEFQMIRDRQTERTEFAFIQTS